MSTLDALKCYKVTGDSLDEGKELTLKKGLKIKLRPYGTTAFYKAYLETVDDIESVTPDHDIKATNSALVKTVITCIGEGKDAITKPEEILAILEDPTYFLLRQEIMEVSKDMGNFTEKK